MISQLPSVADLAELAKQRKQGQISYLGGRARLERQVRSIIAIEEMEFEQWLDVLKTVPQHHREFRELSQAGILQLAANGLSALTRQEDLIALALNYVALGQLRDAIRESEQIAHEWELALLDGLGLDADGLEEYKRQLHAPIEVEEDLGSVESYPIFSRQSQEPLSLAAASAANSEPHTKSITLSSAVSVELEATSPESSRLIFHCWGKLQGKSLSLNLRNANETLVQPLRATLVEDKWLCSFDLPFAVREVESRVSIDCVSIADPG